MGQDLMRNVYVIIGSEMVTLSAEERQASWGRWLKPTIVESVGPTGP